MIKIFKDNRTIIKEKISFFLNKGLGEKKDNYLLLDIYETLYCLEKKWLSLPNLSFEDLLKKLKKREFIKYEVYKFFKQKGYIIKTGFKFGFDFRIYPKGKKPGEAHTEKVVYVLEEQESLSGTSLSRLSRLATNLRTSLILAIIDSENEINFYSFERCKI